MHFGVGLAEFNLGPSRTFRLNQTINQFSMFMKACCKAGHGYRGRITMPVRSILRPMFLLVVIAVGPIISAEEPNYAALLLMDGPALVTLKKRIDSNALSQNQTLYFNQLRDRADAYLKAKNPSVVNKSSIPPSGDKHDYQSLSRYWWPDATQADGLPWIRKDGITNPDSQTDCR